VLENIPSDVGRGEQGLGRNRDHVRQHNLSTILTLLHREGSLSRSVLTQRTGLNRSTISDLVAELETLGLASESPTAPSGGAGRPSILVEPSDAVIAFAAAIDIDAISVAAIGLSGRVISRKRRRTPDAPAAGTAVVVIRDLIAQLRADLGVGVRVAGVGVAVPGQVRQGDGLVRQATFLNWREAHLAERLENEVNLPVFIDNDARLGLRAESEFGSGRDFTDLVYLIGRSAGVGGGAIVDGRPLAGASGYGGDLGLIRISDGPLVQLTGQPGTLADAIQRDDLLDAAGLVDADDATLLEHIRDNPSSRIRRVITPQIDALALGISSLINLFNPQAVVLAGYLSILYSLETGRLLERVSLSALTHSLEDVEIIAVPVSSSRLLIGAAELPFAPLLNAPGTFAFRNPTGLRAVSD
jgi:predicted NBD/HSP70 family sugar kinase